jgi:hypothetical protein
MINKGRTDCNLMGMVVANTLYEKRTYGSERARSWTERTVGSWVRIPSTEKIRFVICATQPYNRRNPNSGVPLWADPEFFPCK